MACSQVAWLPQRLMQVTDVNPTLGPTGLGIRVTLPRTSRVAMGSIPGWESQRRCTAKHLAQTRHAPALRWVYVIQGFCEGHPKACAKTAVYQDIRGTELHDLGHVRRPGIPVLG